MVLIFFAICSLRGPETCRRGLQRKPMSLLVPGLTIFAQDLAAPMNCGQSSPPMVSSRNPRPTHLKPLPSDQGRTSGLPHPANLSPSGARSNRPHHPSADVGASAKTQQQQSRGRAAALAQTYMPINRSELRQIVRMRAPPHAHPHRHKLSTKPSLTAFTVTFASRRPAVGEVDGAA